MDLSLKWLSDYVTCDMPVKELTDGLTMSGSKVEKVKDLSDPLKKVVIGKVLEIYKHQDSEKLWITKIDIGNETPIQIVTGAGNVFAGAYVPVVLDGGVVLNRADGTVTKIKKGKLRGEISEGMLCSFDELGLSASDFPYADKDGILIFNNDPDFENIKIGMDACEFVGLKDHVIEFEITNNRPDCFSVLGLAREVSATFNLPLKTPNPTFKGISGKPELTVKVENKDLCIRYMAAVVKNAKIMQSPKWMRERLHASGVRPINNFVDITNFVMLEYGHPMHAFDKRYVEGDKIIVRNAVNGEEITLLDGTVQTLDSEMLVIADAKKPVAVAGVMGGEYSGIMDDTTTVVFESARFDGTSVRKSAKKIGRRTESSSRFEKNLCPINAEKALIRALQLVEELGCGEVICEVIDEKYFKEEPRRLKHNFTRINDILGSDISEMEQINIFKRLGFEYDDEESYLYPPFTRTDILRECDLAEEVARIYGYNNIKSTVPRVTISGTVTKEEILLEKLETAVLSEGYFGVLTYGFISPRSYTKANIVSEKNVVIRNPLGEDTSIMRTSMLPSMLEVIARNYNNRSQNTARFYEISRIYLPSDNGELPKEEKVLALGMYGGTEDFYSIKGTIESVLGAVGVDVNTIRFTAQKSNKSYHSGRCAEVWANDVRIGIFGEVHPTVRENFDIGVRTYAAEIEVERLTEIIGDVKKYKPLPRFPATTRDLSFVCSEETQSGKIVDIIKKTAKHLESITFFDMYKGENLGDNMKSLSYNLVFRKSDTTLTDNEIDPVIKKILKALEEENVTLRQ